MKIFSPGNKAAMPSIPPITVEDPIAPALLAFSQFAGVQGKAGEDSSQ
jgi:hypothetical protein